MGTSSASRGTAGSGFSRSAVSGGGSCPRSDCSRPSSAPRSAMGRAGASGFRRFARFCWRRFLDGISSALCGGAAAAVGTSTACRIAGTASGASLAMGWSGFRDGEGLGLRRRCFFCAGGRRTARLGERSGPKEISAVRWLIRFSCPVALSSSTKPSRPSFWIFLFRARYCFRLTALPHAACGPCQARKQRERRSVLSFPPNPS